MFEEQVRWSKEEGVDYIIAETISHFAEARIALGFPTYKQHCTKERHIKQCSVCY